MHSLRALPILALALLLAGPLAAQTPPGCRSAAAQEPSSPTALDRHRQAVRALPGRVNVEDVPCPAEVARLGDAARRAAEGSIEVQQRWDASGDLWSTTGRILRAIDDEGQLTERVRQSPYGTGWLNVEQTLFASDEADQIQTVSRWADQSWQPSTRVTYFYRADQRSLGDRNDVWDADAAIWRVAAQRTVEYDAQDRLTLVLSEALDMASLQTLPVDRTLTSYSPDGRESVAVYQRWQAPDRWIPSTRTTVVLDAEGDPLSTLTEARQAGAWVPQDRTLYDLSGTVDTVRSQSWNPGPGVWENTFQTLRDMAPGSLESEEVTQSWTGEEWANVSRTRSVVDGSGRLVDFVVSVWEEDAWEFRRWLRRDYADAFLISEIVEQWDAPLQTWRLSSDVEQAFIATGDPLRRVSRSFADDGVTIRTGSDTGWAYDASDRTVSRMTTVWDPTAMAWVNSTRSLYEYGTVPVDTEDAPEGVLALTVSPNPASAMATLRLTLPASTPVRVDLFSVTGRLVQSVWNGSLPSGRSEHRLDLGALAPGVYLVRADAEAGVATRVVTVVR